MCGFDLLDELSVGHQRQSCLTQKEPTWGELIRHSYYDSQELILGKKWKIVTKYFLRLSTSAISASKSQISFKNKIH